MDLSSIREKKELIDKLKNEVKNQYRQIMLDAVKPLFDKYPLLENIGFEANTYYNDNDYSYYANIESPIVNGENSEDSEDGWVIEASEEFYTIMDVFDDSIIEEIFGSANVTFYKDRIETYG